jgi:tetratricopeptide (TPR) repeat protein
LSSSAASLAHKVRQARLEAGLTHAQLAGGKVDPVTIHRIESGWVRPTRRILSYIASRVGKPIQHFLDCAAPDETEIEWALLRGRIRRAAGDFESSQRLFESAGQMALDAHDASRVGLARVELAAARLQRRWTSARETELASAQEEAGRFGHLHAVACSHYAHAVALHARGDYARACEVLDIALAGAGDMWPGLRARCLAEHVRIALERGEDGAGLQAQLNHLVESLAPRHAAEMWEARAIEAERNGNLPGAVSADQQGLMLREDLVVKRHEAVTRYHLGRAARNQGQTDDALAEFISARSAARDVGDPFTEAQVLIAMADIYTGCGRISEASAVLEQARSVFAIVAQTANGNSLAKPAQAEPPIRAGGSSADMPPASRMTNAECPPID